MRIGSNYLCHEECEFVVWAPFLSKVELEIVAPQSKVISLERNEKGYWGKIVEDVSPRTLYFYKLEGYRSRPDPASHFQPSGIDGPSGVVEHNLFNWEDENWRGIALSEMIIYEIHVGTFTPEGTFEAIIPRLDELRNIGINAIEIMPVGQFPGERNWGYDGVYPFAVHNSYGGPKGLKRLVNLCHQCDIAVILDVVYNHLGPEGNCLWEYGPYFTEKYKTPWGRAFNFDDHYSDEVKNFFIENALYWFRCYHVDALRLDAINGIYDMSNKHFLQELAEKIEEFSNQQGRKFYLIAESDLNDLRVTQPKELGGYGIDAQWCDDFHHSLHTILTGEDGGCYKDFGNIGHLVKAEREGFVYAWYYTKDRRGRNRISSRDIPAQQIVVFSQNHDQIGNRMLGERLSKLVSFEALKLVAGTVLFSPYIPLLFMGEEYGEESPFLYFASHTDLDIIAAIREGRKRKFQAFKWSGDLPDPQNLETFLQSKIRWEKRTEGKHKILLAFYRLLIQLRKDLPALKNLDKNNLEVFGGEEDRIIFIRRWHDQNQVLSIMNFNTNDVTFCACFTDRRWKKVLDSSDKRWMGPGSLLPEEIEQERELIIRPLSYALYEREVCSST